MTKYTQNKDVNQIVKQLVKDGWVFSINGHCRVTHPSGKYVTFSFTPSDGRAVLNFKSDIKKILRQIESNHDNHQRVSS